MAFKVKIYVDERPKPFVELIETRPVAKQMAIDIIADGVYIGTNRRGIEDDYEAYKVTVSRAGRVIYVSMPNYFHDGPGDESALRIAEGLE